MIIKKMLLESKTEDEFKDKFITVYDPSKNLNHDQDIIARFFWMGRKELIRKEKLKRLIKN